MLNKKVLLSILIIGAVVAMAGAATWATLSDTKSSVSQITTGTLTLDSTSIDPISIVNTAPGDSGTETRSVTIGGTLPGLLTIGVNNAVVPNTANTSAPTPHDTKLGDKFKVNIKLTDNSDLLLQRVAGSSDDDYVLLSAITPLSNVPVDSGATYKIVTKWKIDPEADNGIQGQSVSFDENYTLSSRAGQDKS